MDKEYIQQIAEYVSAHQLIVAFRRFGPGSEIAPFFRTDGGQGFFFSKVVDLTTEDTGKSIRAVLSMGVVAYHIGMGVSQDYYFLQMDKAGLRTTELQEMFGKLESLLNHTKGAFTEMYRPILAASCAKPVSAAGYGF